MSRLLIRNARIPGAGEANLAIEDGKIAGLGPGVACGPEAEELDAEGRWVVPGWIDLQVNDIGWLAGGYRDPGVHAGRIREVLSYQAATGVTGCVLATLAAPLDEIIAYLGGMKEILSGTGNHDEVLLGGLVEGTFMNPEFQRWLDWYRVPLEAGGARLTLGAPQQGRCGRRLRPPATRCGTSLRARTKKGRPGRPPLDQPRGAFS